MAMYRSLTAAAVAAAVAPSVPRALLVHDGQGLAADVLQEATRSPWVRAIHLERTQADPGAVARYARRGLRIGAWTVDDPVSYTHLDVYKRQSTPISTTRTPCSAKTPPNGRPSSVRGVRSRTTASRWCCDGKSPAIGRGLRRAAPRRRGAAVPRSPPVQRAHARWGPFEGRVAALGGESLLLSDADPDQGRAHRLEERRQCISPGVGGSHSRP